MNEIDLVSLLAPESNRETYIRCPFSYPGSKYRSLDHILPHLPYTDTYVEPFGGSGAVLLARNESKLEVLNDRYLGITCFYRCIREKEKLDKLVQRLEFLVHSREEFIWCKNTWENCSDDIERAARWYYMICYSFGSCGRSFGRSIKSTGRISGKIENKLKLFYPLHQRIKKVQIENLDYKQCLFDYDSKETVFYIDPPYFDVDTGTYRDKFDRKNHIELLNIIHNEIQGFVALSGYYDEIYNNYEWDDIINWTVRDTIKTVINNPNRGTSKEYLYIKYKGIKCN